MKTIQLTVLFLICPLVFFAQTLTGLWIGTVNNDSTTIRKDQSFEIVLTQYKNKVYGYSRSTFVVNDSLFYIVKRVKGTIEGDLCEVKDDGVVSYNFHGRLDKGVKMVSSFRFDHEDSVWRMDGDWKTNKTKKYYSVSGKIKLAQEKDLEKSKIFPHLEELNLANDVAFYKESKTVPESTIAKNQPTRDKPNEETVKEERSTGASVKEKPEVIVQAKQPETKQKPVIADAKENKKENVIVVSPKTETVVIQQSETNNQKENIAKEQKPAPIQVKEVKAEPTAQTKQPVSNPANEQAVVEEKKVAAPTISKKDSDSFVQSKSNPVTQTIQPANDPKMQSVVKETKPEPKKPEPVVINKPVEQKKEIITEPAKTEIKNKETVPVASVAQEPVKQKTVSVFSDLKPENAPTAAVFVAERKIAAPQVVFYKSDSLELALYDNGEVDGDTVSVLLNGEIILAKQGLKASAIKKTIHIPPGKDDEVKLVLYAENLGKYPPNTGLLIVHDGDDTYQIRFSADLQQNAAVIFKRKKN